VTESLVGRFRIIDSLGSGGMGEVFLAEDSRLRRKVALKKLSSSLRADPDHRRRLLHEARAAARINHPHIAAIYDIVDADDGNTYIVMEYVPGQTLASRVETGALGSDEVLRLALQVTDALVAAHARGVVHGDLKPANLHLLPDGEVKILDFGLASTHQSESSAAFSDSTDSEPDVVGQAGVPGGTLPYMPPETFDGKAAGLRGDIYSLGVTLFELLTGRRPFTGDSQMALVLAIKSQPTPRASEVNPLVSEALSAVVARAMARSPEDRHPTAGELLDDLRTVAAGGSKFVPRVAGVVTLALAVFLAFWLGQKQWSPEETKQAAHVIAVLPFLSISPDSNAAYIASGMTDVIGTNLASLAVAVVPSGQTSRYNAPDRDINALTRELGASMVIDGTVHKYGNQLRVTVRMIRAGSPKLDWTRTFDGNVTSVLGLQGDVLGGIADGLTRTGIVQADDELSARHLVRQPTADEEAYADYIQARSFLERRDVPENITRAMALFESASIKDTTFAQALGGLGEAYWAQYRKTRDPAWSGKAGQTTRKAAARDPENVAVRYSLSVILEGTGEYGEAVDELLRVIDSQPGNDAAHSLLGGVYDKQGRKADALREFRSAIALRPAYWWHHWRLGTFYFNNSQFDQAAVEALRVTELQPDNARGFQLLGTIRQAQGRMPDALEAYETCLRISPTASAYSNMGGACFDDEKFLRAIDFYRKAVELDPRLPVYRRNLGDAYLEAGRRDSALESYSSAVRLAEDILKVNPADANTMALLGLCLAKSGNAESAVRTIEEAARLTPRSNYVLYKQTAIYSLLNRKTEALSALKSALEAGASRREAAKDPDLRSISGTSEFRKLVST
jgi:serine/threonine protein kinase/tetratricopeptide (TPR) repeat protein